MGNYFDDSSSQQSLDRSQPDTQANAQHVQHMRDDAFPPPPAPRNDFVGIDLGFVRLGVQNGSLQAGVDLGFAGAGGSIGRDTGVSAGADLGPLGSAHGDIGAAIDRSGIHAGAGAGADALGLAGASAGVITDAGAYNGAQGSVDGFAGSVDANLAGRTYIDPYGAEARAAAKLRFQNPDY